MGREVYPSPPSRDMVKNEWIYTPSLPVGFHGVNRHDFTVTFAGIIKDSKTEKLNNLNIPEQKFKKPTIGTKKYSLNSRNHFKILGASRVM